MLITILNLLLMAALQAHRHEPPHAFDPRYPARCDRLFDRLFEGAL